jgi:hypothetical protein
MTDQRDDDSDELDGGDGDGIWELDPNDPSHPDFDLSEAAGHTDYDQRRRLFTLPHWLLLLVTIIVLVALLWPFWWRILT